MSTPAWIALAIALAVVIAATAVLAVRALAAWRAARSFQRRVTAGLGEVNRRVADVERRLSEAGGTAGKLEAARAQLQESLATASVLADAAGEARNALGVLRGFVPRK